MGAESETPVWGQDSPASLSLPLLAPLGAGPESRWVADGGRHGRLLLSVASVVGVRHRLAGVTSEDAFAWKVTPSGGLALAVADGVGSVPGSGWASRMACEVATTILAEGDGTPDWEAVDALVREEVGGVGGATTLSAAWISHAGVAHTASVGDSQIRVPFVLGRRDAAVPADIGLCATGDRGDFAAHQGDPAEDVQGPHPGSAWAWDELGFDPEEMVSALTSAYPATSATLAETGRVIALGPDNALVIMTDGIGDPLIDGPETVAPALLELIGSEPGPIGLLAGTDFRRRGCGDDRTLVVVRVNEEGPNTSEDRLSAG